MHNDKDQSCRGRMRRMKPLLPCAHAHALLPAMRNSAMSFCDKRSLKDFLDNGLSCHRDLMKCESWCAFCRSLPRNVSVFLEKVKDTRRDEAFSAEITTDDDYRFWLANIAGSLIRAHTLDAFQASVACKVRRKRYTNAESLAIMELLSYRPCSTNSRAALWNATGRALQTGRRQAAFDLDLYLDEVSVLQCATHNVRASNSFLICSSKDCLTQAKTQLEGDESTLHDVNLLSACVSKFALVCGASGSGKTMAALTSCGSEGLVWHTTAHGLGNFEELSGDSRDVAVLKAISDTIKRRIEGMTISTTFEDNFVLVVDDAGNMPGLVRSLCRVEKSIREEVATLLKLSANRTSFLVCGNGVERADGARGSVPSSYCLINLSNPKNELSFFKSYTLPRIRNMFPLLAAALTNPSLSGCDAINRHSIVLQCRRLLRNRHMAALFLTQLKKLERWSASQREEYYCDSRWWPMQLVASKCSWTSVPYDSQGFRLMNSH